MDILYSLVGGHLGCWQSCCCCYLEWSCHVLNICAQVSGSYVKYLGVGELELQRCMHNFLKNCHVVSQIRYHFVFLPGVYKTSSCYTLSTLYILSVFFFNFSLSNMCYFIGVICIFLMVNQVGCLSMCF